MACPDVIHRDSRSERVLRLGQPAREGEATPCADGGILRGGTGFVFGGRLRPIFFFCVGEQFFVFSKFLFRRLQFLARFFGSFGLFFQFLGGVRIGNKFSLFEGRVCFSHFAHGFGFCCARRMQFQPSVLERQASLRNICVLRCRFPRCCFFLTEIFQFLDGQHSE